MKVSEKSKMTRVTWKFYIFQVSISQTQRMKSLFTLLPMKSQPWQTAFFPVSISVSLQKTQLCRTLSGSVQSVCSSVIAIINLAVAARLLLDNGNPTSNISGTVTVTFLAYTCCIESPYSTTKWHIFHFRTGLKRITEVSVLNIHLNIISYNEE